MRQLSMALVLAATVLVAGFVPAQAQTASPELIARVRENMLKNLCEKGDIRAPRLKVALLVMREPYINGYELMLGETPDRYVKGVMHTWYSSLEQMEGLRDYSNVYWLGISRDARSFNPNRYMEFTWSADGKYLMGTEPESGKYLVYELERVFDHTCA